MGGVPSRSYTLICPCGTTIRARPDLAELGLCSLSHTVNPKTTLGARELVLSLRGPVLAGFASVGNLVLFDSGPGLFRPSALPLSHPRASSTEHS